MKVKIPFKPRFKKPLLDGTKTWTSRTKQYGLPHDIFEAFGEIFEIIDINLLLLSVVADHWKEEGCTSRQDFIELWEKIHPRKGYDPSQIVRVHIFRRISI